MKLFKCKVRIIDVREGFEFVQAPNDAAAMDGEWLRSAEIDHGVELPTVKTTWEIIHIQEIKSIGQVPERWIDGIPWAHPKHPPEADLTVREMLDPKYEPEVTEFERDVLSDIKLHEGTISEIKEDITALRSLIPKRKKNA